MDYAEVSFIKTLIKSSYRDFQINKIPRQSACENYFQK